MSQECPYILFMPQERTRNLQLLSTNRMRVTLTHTLFTVTFYNARARHLFGGPERFGMTVEARRLRARRPLRRGAVWWYLLRKDVFSE